LLESEQKVALLFDACQAVLATPDVDEVLNRILAIIRDHFHLQYGAVMRFDRKHQELYVCAQVGLNQADIGLRLAVGRGISGAAAQSLQPVYAPDVDHDPRYVRGDQRIRSEIAIPVIIRGELLGVLDFQSEQAAFFTPEMIDLLTLFSTQVALALETDRLYFLEQRRTQQLEAINAVARQTTAVLDLDELLTVVCRLLLEWFRFDHVAVLLSEGDHLSVRAFEGRLTPTLAMGAQLPQGAGLASRALATGRSVIENDVSRVEGYVTGFLETRSEMCVPLIFLGEKLGVIALDSALKDAFETDDIQPLESVADICAGAIQNANYFERVKQLAYIDGLTGIHNRRFFEMRIAEELERSARFQGRMAVIMVDIDYFKKLNDEFGHLLGDEVLRGVAAILKQQLRKVDMVCRYGGEEFAIVLPETSGENALMVAEKLRLQIARHPFPGVPRPVNISCGVADYPAQGMTRDEVMAAADAALFCAKRTGRNKVVAAAAGKSIVPDQGERNRS
jgi:diguanylate cyclase (GGDEF)-like protein